MDQLIAELEATPEGSRKIDGDIFQLIGGEAWDAARSRASQPCGAPESTVVKGARGYAPCYTTSFNAALTLVKKGRDVSLYIASIGDNQACVADILHPETGEKLGSGCSLTIATALCIAAFLDHQATKEAE